MNPLFQLLDPAKRAAALGQQDVSPETDAALQQIGVKKDADPGIVTGGPVTDTGTPVAAPAAPPSDSRSEVEQRFLDKLRMGRQPGTSGSIVNTAPDWFKAGPPPARQTGPDILNTLVGAGAAGAQRQADLSAKEPLRPFAMKAADQGKANTAAALGGLVGLLANRKQDAYNSNEDAALKQAQMYRALNGNGGSDQELAYLRYKESQDRFAAQQEAARQKAELEDRKNKLDSPETQAAQAAMVMSGTLPEDKARQMTAHQIEKYRTALMQGAQQDFRGNEADRHFAMELAARGANKEAEQTLQIDKEKREEQQKKDQAFIPGTYYVNGHPPSPADSTKARETMHDRLMMTQAADRLKQIQEKISEAHALAGATGSIDQYIGTKEQKALLAESKLLQNELRTGMRKTDNLGVLQQFEKTMEDALNPEAGSIQAFFKGPEQWDAIKKFYDEDTARRLRVYGYGLPGDGGEAGSTAQDKPTEQQVRIMPKPVVHAYKRGGQGEEIPVPSPVSGSAPAASEQLPMPGATGSTPVGVFTVKTAKGNSSPRPMTQAQYEKAVQAFGADNVTRMQ